jgi:hypothetical protein
MLAGELEKLPPPAIGGPNSLVLSIPPAYNQSQEILQEADRLRKVEDALRKTTGRPWVLRIETAATTADGAGVLPPPAGPQAVPAKLAPRNLREEAEKLPLIRRAMEVLGASVQRVDEGFGALPEVRPPAEDVPPDDEEA